MKKKIYIYIYTRQYTPTEIIQTAFIFCIFNIMLEFLKPLPLIFRNIYHITISRNFQRLAPSICTLADLLLLEESTFFIRFDPLPFSAGLPRIPLDIWKTAEDKGGR